MCDGRARIEIRKGVKMNKKEDKCKDCESFVVGVKIGKQEANNDFLEFLKKREHLLYLIQANVLTSCRKDIEELIKETKKKITQLSGKEKK